MTVPKYSAYKKNIGFVFHNTNGSVPPSEMLLPVKPEDLARQDTSRLTVHHTLGGAFADNFGKGFPSLQISGHTGWGTGKNPNGWEFFIKLHKFIYLNWHAERKRETDKQGDPDKVKLILNNDLDGFIWVVAPMSFTLKRSIANPLLVYYQINLLWLDDYLHAPDFLKLPEATTLLLGLDSMDLSLNRLDDFKTVVANDIYSNFTELTPDMLGVMDLATSLNREVQSLIQTGSGALSELTTPLYNATSSLTLAAHNILDTVGSVYGIAQQTKSELMFAKSQLMNLYCILNNVLKPPKDLLNFDQLFGASLCSSTAGGSPVSTFQSNSALEYYLPVTNEKLTMSTDAAQAVAQLNSMDNVLITPNLTSVNSLSATVVSGTRKVA